MALKMQVESLDAVPEALREMYAPIDDGKAFRLQVDGVEDPVALKGALKKEREQREQFERRLKEFEGLDPKEARAFMERFANDEEMKLLKDGKVDVLRERWVGKLRDEYDKKLKAKDDEIVAAKETGKKWSQRVLDNAIREGAAKVGIHSYAVKDALRQGREVFTLNDDGEAVQMRDGTIIMGKDGKTPFGPAEWIESQREESPHWFPASAAGSGAPPGKGGAGNGKGGKTMRRAEFDQLPPKVRTAFIREGGAVVDG